MDAIQEILSASNSIELFGPNEKRAKIRYRRLVREVHPDSNDSPDAEEAMKKLNRLWSKYNARTGAVRRECARVPEEITRNDTFAIFSEGDKWLVVERRPDGNGRFESIDNDALLGTPICFLGRNKTKAISQPDGIHAAYETVPTDAVSGGRRIMFLSSIGPMLPDKMHEADFAWITKRVLFLSCLLADRGVTLDGKVDCLAIAPDTHVLAVMACVAAPVDVLSDRDKLILQYLDCMVPIVRECRATERIERFMRGVIGDRWVSTGDLMREYDNLMYELFGGIKWHDMQTI